MSNALPLGLAAALAAGPALAQPAQADTATQQTVVVTGERVGTLPWTSPATFNSVDGEQIRHGQMQINLGEGLGLVPGLIVRERGNYAQDLQISMRGFGARAPFGVRGLRLYVDGIPISSPDGQGQSAGFPLSAADRIDVIRGPFAALFGNASGGVIALTTAEGAAHGHEWRSGLALGEQGLWRASTQASGAMGSWHYLVDASAMATDGLRPQAEASRATGYAKLGTRWDGGKLTLLAMRQVSRAQDPLGLTRAEWDADPFQTTPVALSFNTRKWVQLNQGGAALQQQLGGGHALEAMAYAGTRTLTQYQAIPVGAQNAPGSGGGMFELDRNHHGANLRWVWHSQPWRVLAGVQQDDQREDRLGYNNYTGPASAPEQLGVQGLLRRDETNRAESTSPYAQFEWTADALTLAGGVRSTRVTLSSADRYIAPGNGDDSGRVRYSATQPTLGLRLALAPELQAFISAGRGLETPTLNEVAYRPDGTSGMNTDLRAATSTQVEAGLRGRGAWGAWSATAFHIRTTDEIAVATNRGGRATYQNAGATRRLGLELSGDGEWELDAAGGGTLQAAAALTWMRATYVDGFLTCTASPCATPNVPIAAGSTMPALPRLAGRLALTWQPQPMPGVSFTAELPFASAVWTDDRHSDHAAGYALINLSARFTQKVGAWTWRQFLRVDNLLDQRYAGSVIVNEGNGRFFETAPGRNFAVGIEASLRY
ncbi:MAG: TonB-dependent receptor [Proteobacteria bacterium]|nr:TonB-dependent receptor [Pseudomonadota bacterium]